MGFALVTAVGWGLNWPVPKYLLTELPPLYLIVEYGVNTETNVELVPVCGGGAAMLAALKQGTIDRFALSSPTSDVAVRDVGAAYLIDIRRRRHHSSMTSFTSPSQQQIGLSTNAGRLPLWVKSAALDVDHALPVYPNKRTFSEPRLTSEMGQTRTLAVSDLTARPCTT
jgi:hypothetical protein